MGENIQRCHKESTIQVCIVNISYITQTSIKVSIIHKTKKNTLSLMINSSYVSMLPNTLLDSC